MAATGDRRFLHGLPSDRGYRRMLEVAEHGRDGNDREDDSQQGCHSRGTAPKKAGSPPAGSRPTKGVPTSRSWPTTPTSSAKPSPPSWSLVTEPNDGMQPIYSLMSSARDTLDMTMYELADPATVSILEADARRGVRVRVLLDQDYSGYSVNKPDFSQLGSNGVQVRWAPAGTIFHQKTITVDNRTSAIMTLNLTSEYYSTTRDFAVITTDRADVAAIEQVFDADWTNSGAPATGPTGSKPGLVAGSRSSDRLADRLGAPLAAGRERRDGRPRRHECLGISCSAGRGCGCGDDLFVVMGRCIR